MDGASSTWTSPEGIDITLPVVLDHAGEAVDGGEDAYRIEATIDLVDGSPCVTRVVLASSRGLDLVRLQREFRWASPLEAVTRLVPVLVARGMDPFDVEFPLHGFPEVTRGRDISRRRLTDEFLEDVARQYLEVGRGYARVLAQRHSVSERTVVSWIERARRRGILTAVAPGSFGGELVPPAARHGGAGEARNPPHAGVGRAGNGG